MVGSSTQEQTTGRDLPHGEIKQEDQNVVAKQSTGTSVLKHVGCGIYLWTS